jgi:hypothetical protein
VTPEENIVVDGYDVLAEKRRETFAARVLAGRSLHRGQALLTEGVSPNSFSTTSGDGDDGDDGENLVTSGLFVQSISGLSMNLVQGREWPRCDTHHARISERVSELTDADGGGSASTELAKFVNRLTAERLPQKAPWSVDLSPSADDARELGLNRVMSAAEERLVAEHGVDVWEQLLGELQLSAGQSPCVLVSCHDDGQSSAGGGFEASQCVAFSARVSFNGTLSELDALFDDHSLADLLETPGALCQVLAGGRFPAELFAGFVVEVCQGERGFGVADREWLAVMAAATRERRGLLCVDELHPLGRTGQLYAIEHMTVEPDILWLALSPNVGVTVTRAGLGGEQPAQPGEGCSIEPSVEELLRETAMLELLVEHKEPVFEGRSFLENSRIKGEYVRMGLAALSAAHPEVLTEFSGLGCLWGLSVEHCQEVVETARSQGLRLLSSGLGGQEGRIRLVLLADVLTHEVDEMMAALDRTLTKVEENHPDD